jgi:hypothetical protein
MSCDRQLVRSICAASALLCLSPCHRAGLACQDHEGQYLNGDRHREELSTLLFRLAAHIYARADREPASAEPGAALASPGEAVAAPQEPKKLMRPSHQMPGGRPMKAAGPGHIGPDDALGDPGALSAVAAVGASTVAPMGVA